MSQLMEHAKRELDLLPPDPEEPDNEMDQAMRRHILGMVAKFSEEGHSGFSAMYAVSVLEKLLRFEPLGPLTGDESEWFDVSEYFDEPTWQNMRCSRVFKDSHGSHDNTAIVFEDPSGCRFTTRGSSQPVTFPYTPTTRVVQVNAEHDIPDEIKRTTA